MKLDSWKMFSAVMDRGIYLSERRLLRPKESTIFEVADHDGKLIARGADRSQTVNQAYEKIAMGINAKNISPKEQ